jgi:hypothetical protein
VEPGTLPTGLGLQDALEVSQELGQASLGVVGRLALGLVLLVLVVQTRRDRVMRVVNLITQSIQSGEGKLIDVINPIAFIVERGRKSKVLAEIEQNVGGLADDQIAVSQKRRRASGSVEVIANSVCTNQASQLGDDGPLVGHGEVFVLDAGFFETETDVLAPARDSRPVDQLVGSVLRRILVFGSGHDYSDWDAEISA